MKSDKLTQEHLDNRLILDRAIQNLIGSAFEDFGMDGIRYIAHEVKRLLKNAEKHNRTGRII